MVEHPGLRDSVQDDADTDEETVTHQVCFSIVGEGTTRIVRDFWQSQLPYNAIEVLKCIIGLPVDEYMPIILGTRRLNGDSRDDTLGIEDDDSSRLGKYDPLYPSMEYMFDSLQDKLSKLNLEMFLRFGALFESTVASKAIREFKPVFDSFNERLQAIQKHSYAAADWLGIDHSDIDIYDGAAMVSNLNTPDYIADAKVEIKRIMHQPGIKPDMMAASVMGVAHDAIARNNIMMAKEMGLYDDDVEDEWDASPEKMRNAEDALERFQGVGLQAADKMEELGKIAGIQLPDLDAHLAQNHIYDPDNIKPESIKTTKFNSGYIDPAGRFYGCPDIQHMGFADDMYAAGLFVSSHDDKQVVLDMLGYVKFSMGRFYCEKPLTQGQIDTLFDWAISREAHTIRFNDETMTMEKMLEKNG